MQTYVPRLKKTYKDEVVEQLMDTFGYKSVMQVPELKKITINQGVNGSVSDKKLVDLSIEEMTQIAGQKAVPTKARKAISSFHLRENMPIGAKVTLRRDRMYEFLDRFISISLPRVRDFQGIPSNSFDGGGNYTVGINEQIIFPEINIDKVTRINGMDITFVTTAKSDEEAKELLRLLGLPFQN